MDVSEFNVQMRNRVYACRACSYTWNSTDKRRPRACPQCLGQSIDRITGESLRRDEYWERVRSVFKTSLSYREREILKLRYGAENGYEYSVCEIAQIFGCSTSCVYRVEATAIRKLASSESIQTLKKLGFKSRYARLTMPEGLKRLIRKVLG